MLCGSNSACSPTCRSGDSWGLQNEFRGIWCGGVGGKHTPIQDSREVGSLASTLSEKKSRLEISESTENIMGR